MDMGSHDYLTLALLETIVPIDLRLKVYIIPPEAVKDRIN